MGVKDIEKYRFTKGKSGNPKGRPPVTMCVSDALRSMGDHLAPPKMRAKLETELGADLSDLTIIEVGVMQALWKMIKGENSTLEFITNRLEGSVAQNLNLNSSTTKKPIPDALKAALAAKLLEGHPPAGDG